MNTHWLPTAGSVALINTLDQVAVFSVSIRTDWLDRLIRLIRLISWSIDQAGHGPGRLDCCLVCEHDYESDLQCSSELPLLYTNVWLIMFWHWWFHLFKSSPANLIIRWLWGAHVSVSSILSTKLEVQRFSADIFFRCWASASSWSWLFTNLVH